MSRFLLVRHCESSGQAPEAPLTGRGRRQAQELVPFLREFEIDYVASSPYQRALETIAPFARECALPIHEDARLRERELASEPLPDWLDHIERSFRDLEYRHPTGESGLEAQQRAWTAIDSVLSRGPRLPLFVAHGNLISLVLRRIDASVGFDFWQRLSNPDVYALERNRGWTCRRAWRPPRTDP